MSIPPNQRVVADSIFLRRIDDDGLKYDGCYKWRSIDGQDADSNTTSNHEHCQQHIAVWNQRNHSTQNVEHPTNMCPTLQEIEPDHLENVGSISGYQYGKQPYQIWKVAILTRAESRAICNLAIQTCSECILGTSRLLTIDSTISGTTVPTTTISENATSNLEFQQNMSAIVQDLKTQVGQLANSISYLQSSGSSNLPSQPIPNPRGNMSVVTLRSGKVLQQPAPQQLSRSANADSEPDANS
ncbi:hypothetical protein CR513_39570, partial [Mucuna pruriens]